MTEKKLALELTAQQWSTIAGALYSDADSRRYEIKAGTWDDDDEAEAREAIDEAETLAAMIEQSLNRLA